MNKAAKIAGPLNRFWNVVEKQSFHIYLVHQFVINAILLTFTFTGIAIKWVPLMFVSVLISSLAITNLWFMVRNKTANIYRRAITDKEP